MYLKIKIKEAHGVLGEKAIMLCDESGEMLPMQVEATVSNGMNSSSTVTAKFVIDGDQVAFE